MATYGARVQMQYKHPTDGNYRVLTPTIETTADVVESAGSLSVSLLYHDFTGTNYSIPSGVQLMEITVWIRRTNADTRWVPSGQMQINALRALQSSLAQTSSGYLEVFGTISTPVSVTLTAVTLSGVSYYRFIIEISASSSSYNTDAGRQYFSMTASVVGAVQQQFEPLFVEFFNGHAYAVVKRYDTVSRVEMVNSNGVWFPLYRYAHIGNGYVEKMVVYGLWAYIYVSGLGKFRVKLANYQFGRF